MNLSFWERSVFFESIDLLVIGSGIVGINAAIHYKKQYPFSKVTIVDRSWFSAGASTKNAGFACFGSVSELLDDIDKFGEKTCWETVVMRYKGLQRLQAIVGKKNMEYLQYGGFEVFTQQSDFENCRENLSYFNKTMKAELGLKNVYRVNHSKIKDSGLKGFKYAIENKFEGQLNSGLMMKKLHEIATKLGIVFLNGIEIKSIATNVKGVVVETQEGILKASKVIVATNGFAGKLLKLKEVLPARAQVLLTSEVKNLDLKGAFHFNAGYYYFRNVGNRILLGGGRNLDFKKEETTEFGLTKKIQSKLNEMLDNMILPGKKYTVEMRWSGIMGVGAEKKPIIKAISQNVVCAVRMGGMGVAIGTLVGEEASKLIISMSKS